MTIMANKSITLPLRAANSQAQRHYLPHDSPQSPVFRRSVATSKVSPTDKIKVLPQVIAMMQGDAVHKSAPKSVKYHQLAYG